MTKTKFVKTTGARGRRALATALLVVAPAAFATVPADAATPTKLAPVAGLQTAVAKPADGPYRVRATWEPLTEATSYRASLVTADGQVVARTVSADPQSSLSSSLLRVGSVVRVRVVALNGKRPGRAATVETTLPDLTAPKGSFGVTSDGNTAILTQLDLEDDLTPAAQVTRTVDWGDGAGEAWPADTTIGHTYSAVGTYPVVIALTDAAGNTRAVNVQAVIGTTPDTTAPKVALTRPKDPRHVTSWVRLRGTASDGDESGAITVTLRVVEKRNGVWYAYRPGTRTWVKGGSTRAHALAKSRPAARRVSDDTWTSRISGLRKGVLVIRLSARDSHGNQTPALTYRQRLTRR